MTLFSQVFKTIFVSVLFVIFLSASLSIIKNTSAHAIFPPEVVEFIEQHPNVTDDELNTFFQETYGYTLEEYMSQDSTQNKLYDPNFDVLAPSQEYLDLQAQGKVPSVSNSSTETLNQLTEKALQNNPTFQKLKPEEKNLFLQNALQLKYEGSLKVKEKTIWQKIKTYINIGVVHILSGMDHILFVISLLLLPLAFRKLLVLISFFTIAHSITLILAGLSLITFSSSIVEPVIAASIIVTTLNAIYLNYKKSKNAKFSTNLLIHIFIIFIFGLFHGLGFAGGFTDLNISSSNYLLPLLSMNIGVELGQLFIIMIAFPIIWVLRNQKYGNILLNIFSVITIVFAGIWFFERIV